MLKKMLLTVVLIGLLAMPAAGSRCYVGGSARKQICICTVSGRSHGAPMWMCR